MISKTVITIGTTGTPHWSEKGLTLEPTTGRRDSSSDEEIGRVSKIFVELQGDDLRKRQSQLVLNRMNMVLVPVWTVSQYLKKGFETKKL